VVSVVIALVGVLVGTSVSSDSWQALVESVLSGEWAEKIPSSGTTVRFGRETERGVVRVQCDTETDMMWSFGYVHAMDRSVQLNLLRIIAQGYW
jgi:acyl-homoserine lactone acylase PvdQ